MVNKIQYQNKEGINEISVPVKNQVTSDDMNEIKSVVNSNADELTETKTTTTNFINNANTRLGDMEQSIEDEKEDIEGIQEDLENVYTKTETDNLLANKADIDDIPTDLSQLSNATTKFVNQTQLNSAISNEENARNNAITQAVGTEKTARENADNNLQEQIDAITASSDVVDIVGTYQELQNYDTQYLGDNDIIKVLEDSTHNNATSYYRWKKQQSTWQYVGSEGPYYTKNEADNTFVKKETGKGLSTNDFTDSFKQKLEGIAEGAQVNVIEGVSLNGTLINPTNKIVALTDIEISTNKVTSLSSSSTDTQYPSAKCVYDLIGNLENILETLDVGGGV